MNYYRDITFAAPSASFTNFQALVRIRNDRMKKRISSTYGYDVAFQQNGSDLAFDLDFYDSSTGTGAWWVQVPTLSSNSTSTIRMVYGDPSITTDQSSPATVWSDYAYVYHFNDVNDLSSVIGSYTPANSGSESASLSLVSNPMTGRGMQFEITSGYGTSAYALNIANAFGTNTGTISIFATAEYIQPNPHVMYAHTGWTSYKYYLFNGKGTFDAGGVSIDIMEADSNGFYCYGGSTNTSTIGWSVNGVIRDASSGTPGSMRWDLPRIIATGQASHPTRVVFDEIRISTSTYKPSEWLQYEQNLMMNHASYATYGNEYHSDGTPVIDLFPWIRQQTVLD